MSKMFEDASTSHKGLDISLESLFLKASDKALEIETFLSKENEEEFKTVAGNDSVRSKIFLQGQALKRALVKRSKASGNAPITVKELGKFSLKMVAEEATKDEMTYPRYCALLSFVYFKNVLRGMKPEEVEKISNTALASCVPTVAGALHFEKMKKVATNGFQFFPRLLIKETPKKDEKKREDGELGAAVAMCYVLDYCHLKRVVPSDKITLEEFMLSTIYDEYKGTTIGMERSSMQFLLESGNWGVLDRKEFLAVVGSIQDIALTTMAGMRANESTQKLLTMLRKV